jgi:8-oxo-dGTP pyrophosphatase MutT (NUDIX family)
MNNPHIPSATLLLLRANPFSVLMAKRHANLAFGGGQWVFPGGRIDAADHLAAAAFPEVPFAAARVAAIREAGEEAAIHLDLTQAVPALVPLVRWLAPRGPTRRFDTWFFLAMAPANCTAIADGGEIVEVAFHEPGRMLAAASGGAVGLLPPTALNLRWLDAAGSAAAALSLASARPAPFVAPEVFWRDGQPMLRLDATAGYGLDEYPMHAPARASLGP